MSFQDSSFLKLGNPVKDKQGNNTSKENSNIREKYEYQNFQNFCIKISFPVSVSGTISGTKNFTGFWKQTIVYDVSVLYSSFFSILRSTLGWEVLC